MTRPRAVLVGVEGGIGGAIARRLVAGGADLAVTWFRDEAEAVGHSDVRARLDLADADAAEAVVADLTARLGGLDVLVANAGTNERHDPLATDLASFRRVVDVNLVGTTAVLLAAARAMSDGGRIVVVTSVHEHLPLEKSLAYTASKHALGGVVKVLAADLAGRGITVNSVAPGAIATRMTGREGVDALSTDFPVPVGRMGSPEEVAAVVGFLVSPEASYVTGSSYGVDGGMSLLAPPAAAQQTPWPGRLRRRSRRKGTP